MTIETDKETDFWQVIRKLEERIRALENSVDVCIDAAQVEDTSLENLETKGR